MTNQFDKLVTGDDAIAVAGMRVKSMPEEVLSLPLVVEPAYAVKDGSVIYLTADKKGCTTTQNTTVGFVGVVVAQGIGKSGRTNSTDSYIKGDVVPVMVKGKIWVHVKTKVTELSATVGADAQGKFSTADTALNGVRFAGTSTGSSQNLTILEVLGV